MYQNNHFDADDESEHLKSGSYMKLLQSNNSLPQTPMQQKGVSKNDHVPEQHLMQSISEEQSCRRNEQTGRESNAVVLQKSSGNSIDRRALSNGGLIVNKKQQIDEGS